MGQQPHRSRRGFMHSLTSGSAIALFDRHLLRSQLVKAARQERGHPLAPRPSHFPARAGNLILVNLTGGLSHIDSFDYKPRLQADHGKVMDWRGRPFYLNASPFRFSPKGNAGLMVSELFPMLGSAIDDMAVIRSMVTDHISHGQATLAMHCGLTTIPMPSIGSWISYGLGTQNLNLPPFVVLASALPYMGSQVWDASFLPAYHTGTRLIPGDDPVPHLKSPLPSTSLRELEQAMLQKLNRRHLSERQDDPQLGARIATFNTAAGMMKVAPDVLDLESETSATRRSYGIRSGDKRSIAWQLLAARRMIEHGVRVVEVVHTGSGGNWDSHGDMAHHRNLARQLDQPVAALIHDLKLRGMLDETLVAICTEFGRAPAGAKNEKGRNHHNSAFTCLLAGGGIRGGTLYGQSDDYGNLVAENPVHVHDLHATILHILGLDHEELTYRYAGRDFRLTDVHGRVLSELLI
ncbi:MAG: DUF1501 domain-containing protein [Planctomycetota bacterium]|nr:DUF1501 domain-containing protein [Planctomycetota bacterium]